MTFSDLNAVLGCPIRFSPLNDISKHGEKGVHGLFSLINWTIEIINTFAEEGDPTMKVQSNFPIPPYRGGGGRRV